ncbi:MAG: D-2-hydroxyacid dehydrogenase [Alphaproteobacteria bacterium]|nr:D-2-hydroxyacid dehydrogenase [Alphaproteobacteria bacterium]
MPLTSLHVLVNVLSAQNQTFRMNPERFRAAAARHQAIAARVVPTFIPDGEGLDAALGEAHAMIGWRFEREGFARRAPKLRWLQLTGAGFEHLLPLDWLPRRVALTTASGVHGPKTEEFVAMALLMLHTEIPCMIENQRVSRWEQRFTGRIAGRTVLIVGVGAMGIAAARAARRLGLRVLGVRRSGRATRGVDEMGGLDHLDGFLGRADFVVVAAPATAATEHLIDRRRLGLMRPGAGLVNIGRAAVVDYDALCDALVAGRLGGAILDVFNPEPLPAESRLWHTPRLVIVPHVSSDDANSYADRVLDLFFENAARLLASRPLRNRVVPSRQY